MADQYRIKWALVSGCFGVDRMCIAERKVFLGIWWPIADWRHNEVQAENDIRNDQRLRAPLPEPRIVT